MAAFQSVVWTTGDTITEAKLDSMISNSQSEDAHSANGIIMNNNVPYKAKNAGGTTKNILNKNASDQTTIGENNVRATRPVFLTNSIEILAAGAPASSSWIDKDVTVNTSPRTFAVNLRILRIPASSADYFQIRPNGSTDSSGQLRADCASASIKEYQTGMVGVDSSQIFEHQANDTGGQVQILLLGYIEYVDG